LRGYGHHDLAFLVGGGYPDWATPPPQPVSLAGLTAALADAVRRHSGPIVISSENFYLYPAPQALHALLDQCGVFATHDPAIVVYLRRQDDAHESWYNQTIKAQGYTHDLDACIREFHDLWDYRLQLDRWAAAFGEERLVVRLYEDHAYVGGDLVSDFFSVLGLSTDGIAVPQARVNSGINNDVLEFQRLVNALPLSVQERRRFHRELIALTARTAGTSLFDDTPLLDHRRRQTILDTYADANRAVARRFFNRDELFTPLAPAAAGARSGAVQGLTIEKLVPILGWLMFRDTE
jgi:hypothetical protein